MQTKELTCTCCPMGCQIVVTLDGDKVVDVKGNTCNRGHDYAIDECTNPKRTLTTTVKTVKGEMLSVRTESAIPFSLLNKAMAELAKVTVKTPVRIGDKVLKNVCKTGVDVIATKNID